jgi:hypothetical protein
LRQVRAEPAPVKLQRTDGRERMLRGGIMADITIVHLSTERKESTAIALMVRLAEWVRRPRREPAGRPETRAAWEIAGVTRTDRHDVAPWLFF